VTCGLRDYGVEGQLGLEDTPEAYTEKMVELFREAWRVLRDDGTLWLNLGDGYNGSGGVGGAGKQHTNQGAVDRPDNRQGWAGLKPKDLVGIPWRIAFALQADGWYLRQDIIWHKPNPMPESVKDRCTKAHEYVFLLTKKAKYYYDSEAIKEPATCDRLRGPAVHPCKDTNGNAGLARRDSLGVRNRRDVWTIPTKGFSKAHFAVFPDALVEPCIKAGCPKGGTVLDPFAGSGTTGLAASRLGRNAELIELNPEYAEMARERIKQDAGMFADVE
jgi:DNA modification methylase